MIHSSYSNRVHEKMTTFKAIWFLFSTIGIDISTGLSCMLCPEQGPSCTLNGETVKDACFATCYSRVINLYKLFIRFFINLEYDSKQAQIACKGPCPCRGRAQEHKHHVVVQGPGCKIPLRYKPVCGYEPSDPFTIGNKRTYVNMAEANCFRAVR